MEEKNSSIIIYQSEDGNTCIDVKLENETVWLTQQQLCDLYQTSRTNIVEHIQHIYEDGELEESATCRKFRQVRQEGSRMVERELPYYNLDMIISLGYRVRSRVATHFCKWATELGSTLCREIPRPRLMRDTLSLCQHSFLPHVFSEVFHKILLAKGVEHIVTWDDIPMKNA